MRRVLCLGLATLGVLLGPVAEAHTTRAARPRVWRQGAEQQEVTFSKVRAKLAVRNGTGEPVRVRCIVVARSKWISTAEPYHLGFSQRYRFGFRKPVPPFTTALSGWLTMRVDHPEFEPTYNSTKGTEAEWQRAGMRITFRHCHGRG